MAESIVEQAQAYFDALVKSRFIEMFDTYESTYCFDDVLTDDTRHGLKIDSKYYEEDGEIAIVDQGQSLICGYRTKENGAEPWYSPAIIFGDHTEVFKYVDFPFYLGADGTKLLSVSDGWEPLFVYYWLKYKYRPIGGYRRHFVFVKEMMFSKPPSDLQEEFVSFVHQVDKSKFILEQEVARYDQLVKSRFVELFGPVNNNHMWPVCAMGDLCLVTKLAGYEYSKYITYQKHGEIIMVKATNVKHGKLVFNDEKSYIPKEISDSLPRSQLHEGDVVMTYIGINIGDSAVIDSSYKYHLAPNVAKITPNKKLNSHYLSYFLEMYRSEIVKHAGNTAKAAIGMDKIRKIVIPLPPIHMQEQFVEMLQQVDKSKVMLYESLKKIIPDN